MKFSRSQSIVRSLLVLTLMPGVNLVSAQSITKLIIALKDHIVGGGIVDGGTDCGAGQGHSIQSHSNGDIRSGLPLWDIDTKNDIKRLGWV